MGIGGLLEGEMRRRGWNQAALARHLGIKQQLVSRWLMKDGSGGRPSVESCLIIAERLDLDLAEVMQIAGHLDTADILRQGAKPAEVTDPEKAMVMRELEAILDRTNRRYWPVLRTLVGTASDAFVA